jgi:hypothetical protein
MFLFSSRTFTAVLAFSLSAPALAANLDFVSQGKADEDILSDGVSNEKGQWQSKVQLVFNSKTQRIERRVYRYFDPAPSRQLDMVWYPEDEQLDKAGSLTGVGRMVWRRRDRAAWDPAGIVSVFTGEMRNGRPSGTGHLVTNEGLIYEGAWRDGRANGNGHLKLPSGEEYWGSFREGIAEGQGREFDVTGEVFEGTFRTGLRHGNGKTKLPSGFSYESNWVKGIESPWSRRIRLAQVGGASGLGNSSDIRLGV